jgi:hypothetical protein
MHVCMHVCAEDEDLEDMSMTTRKVDPVYHAFQVRVDFNPQQVLRYSRSERVAPLWMHSKHTLASADVRCHCFVRVMAVAVAVVVMVVDMVVIVVAAVVSGIRKAYCSVCGMAVISENTI